VLFKLSDAPKANKPPFSFRVFGVFRGFQISIQKFSIGKLPKLLIIPAQTFAVAEH
jgi:hypothetical protein